MIHRPLYGLVRKSIEYVMPRYRGLLIALASISIVGSAQFALHAEELTSGTSSRQAKQQALQSIPYQQLTQKTQAKIGQVLKKPSIYRRLPVTAINIDPEYFVFLTRHPEVIVNIWKIMGVTKMSTRRTGPFTIRTDDGVGTISDVELVYGTSNMHIFYGTGTYEGPVLKRKLRGECVLVLRSSAQKSAVGKPTTTSQLDVFLKIENATAGLIAKTLNPIVGTTADHNFVESLNFLQRLNETTEKNGVGVQHMANRLTDISNETRNQFIQVAGQVYERSSGHTTTSSAKPAPPTNYSQPYPTSSQNFQSPLRMDMRQPDRYNAAAQAGYVAPYEYSQPGIKPVTQPIGTEMQRFGVHPTQYQQPAGYLPGYQPQNQAPAEQQRPATYRQPGSPRTSQMPYLAPAYPQANYYHR